MRYSRLPYRYSTERPKNHKRDHVEDDVLKVPDIVEKTVRQELKGVPRLLHDARHAAKTGW